MRHTQLCRQVPGDGGVVLSRLLLEGVFLSKGSVERVVGVQMDTYISSYINDLLLLLLSYQDKYGL